MTNNDEFQKPANNSSKPWQGRCLSPKCVVTAFIILELLLCVTAGLIILLTETTHISELIDALLPYLGPSILVVLLVVKLISGYFWYKNTKIDNNAVPVESGNISNLQPPEGEDEPDPKIGQQW